jgi:hypothetical protein
MFMHMLGLKLSLGFALYQPFYGQHIMLAAGQRAHPGNVSKAY